MKMKICLGILLVLSVSVEAALRLPVDAQAPAPARPWKCCNLTPCTKSIPPICRCSDEVRQCDAACKDCVPSPSNPSLFFVCNDRYVGEPRPICRPSDCCDGQLCTKTQPPTCRCTDVVDQCAATCKDCAAATSDPSRHVCNDRYFGNPRPMCTAVAGGGN